MLIDVRDADEFKVFYGTAMATVEGYLNAGTDLKDKVRAAKIVDDVDAIKDPR